MTSGLTYDTGMLIAAGRGERLAWSIHRRAMVRAVAISVPSGVLAQAWRGGPQPLLSRMLQGCVVRPFDEPGARSVGALCALAGSSDVVDASVVMEALRRDDVVATSDAGDIRHLASAIGTSLEVLEI